MAGSSASCFACCLPCCSMPGAHPAPHKRTALMAANEEDIRILLKAVGRAISMVNIVVENQHLQMHRDRSQ